MTYSPLMVAVLEAQRTLGLSHEKLAVLVQSSKRTVERWSAGRASAYPSQVTRLAAAVYPHDAEIARRLAACIGQSLESLGIVAPPPPPPAPPPAAATPAPAAHPMKPLLVEAVVSAAAEALDVSPRVARPAVLAAVERAKAGGLSVDDLLAVLQPPPPAPPAPPPSAASAPSPSAASSGKRGKG